MTRGSELTRVAREGKRIRGRYVDARVASLLSSAGTSMRIGVIVPRHKHSAVDRNRLKRRLRELIRLDLLPVGLPVMSVLRARVEAYSASFEELRADVLVMRDGISGLCNRGAFSPPSDVPDTI